MVTLRDYQQDAIDRIKESFERGIDRQLIKVFTGGGKSLIAVGIHREIMPGERTLFLVDQIELGEQMVSHFRRNFPDLRVGLEMGNYEENDECDILVASVQTLGHIKSNRFRKFTKRGFKKFILDECFTGETEILTERGFVRFDELTRDLLVAQYDNGNITFTQPSRYINREYEGELLTVETDRGISLRCTPNHELLSINKDGVYVKKPAIRSVFTQNYRYPVAGRHIEGEDTLSPWERLMIAAQADSTIHAVHADNTVTLAFSFSKQRKIDRFLDIVSAGGWKLTEVAGKTDHNATRRRFMVHRLDGASKNIEDHFSLRLISQKKASAIIEEMVEWDGHKPSNGFYYSNTDEKAVDFYQAVAILAGYKTLKRVQTDDRKESYSDVYRLYIKTDLDYVNLQRPAKTVEHFTGRVYCVTVPSGNIVIRRNGKPLVVGNCHKSTAPIWQRVLHAFGVGNQNFDKGKLLVGMTATPNRTDAVGLSINFDDIVCNYDIKYGISNGWLTDIEALYVETGVSLDHIRKSGDEFNQRQLDETLNTQERNGLILQAYRDLVPDQKGIVYCASVAHAYTLTDLFNRNGISAECIEGGTDRKLRKDWIEAYKTGDLQVLFNYAVLTTGFDAPETKFLMLARPIRSTLLFEQIVGRGLRPNAETMIDAWSDSDERRTAIELSDKDVCKVIDLCDSVSKHQLASVASLFGFAPKAKTKKKKFYKDVVMSLEAAKHEGVDVTQIEDVDNIEVYVKKRKMRIGSLDRPAEVTRYSDRGWLLVGPGNYEVPYPKDHKSLMIEKNELDKWELYEYCTQKKTTKKLQTFNDLSGAFKVGDEYADIHFTQTKTYNMNGNWTGLNPSFKQIDFVKRLTKGRGITYDKELKYEDTGEPVMYYKGEMLTRGKMSLLISRLTGK